MNKTIQCSSEHAQKESLGKVYSQDENQEKFPKKKYNFVIIGFGDLGKGWHQLLTESGQQVYVCSLNGRKYSDEYSLKHHIQVYNVYNLPLSYDQIDVVLICCTATDIALLHECLPKKLIQEKSNKFVFFQNGIGIREKIKQLLSNTSHPTQAIPYFSFKTNGGAQVDITIARPSPITGDKQTINTLFSVLNHGPHQSNRFEGMDSIVLRKEERKKGYVNTFLNSICVIYKLPVGQAVQALINEFGDTILQNLYAEFLQFNNEIAGDDLAHMEMQEIQEDIENAIDKFKTKYPSTYYQYYRSGNNHIRSDEQHFIGVIMDQCEKKGMHLPLLENLFHRMQAIKSKINSSKIKF